MSVIDKTILMTYYYDNQSSSPPHSPGNHALASPQHRLSFHTMLEISQPREFIAGFKLLSLVISIYGRAVYV